MKRKIISLFVAFTLIFNLTSCLDGNKDDSKKKNDDADVEELEDNLLDTADDFCKAVSKASYKNIAKLVYDADDDSEEVFEDLYNLSDSEYGKLYEAIINTFEYKIDKKSVNVNSNKGKGSAEVSFEIVDFEMLFDSYSYTDLDSYISEVSFAPERVTVDVEVEFKLDDDEWLVTNAEDVISNLTYYRNFTPDFKTNLSDCVGSLEWYNSNDGVYDNVTWIELDIIPNALGYDADWTLNYEVYYGESNVYTSEYFTDTTLDYIGGYFDTSCNDYICDEEGYLLSGAYTITFFDENNNEIVSSTCNVTRTEIPVETTNQDVVFDFNYAIEIMLENRGTGLNVDSLFFENYYSDGYWFDYGDGQGNSTMINAVTYSYDMNPSLGYVLETNNYDGGLIYTLYYVEDLNTSYSDLFTNSDSYYIDSGYMSNENGGNYYTFEYPYEVNKGAYIIYISPTEENYQNTSGGDFYMFDIVVVQ